MKWRKWRNYRSKTFATMKKLGLFSPSAAPTDIAAFAKAMCINWYFSGVHDLWDFQSKIVGLSCNYMKMTRGQWAIPHIDCRPCFGDVIASLSLLLRCIMRLENPKTSQGIDMERRPNSLLILSGEARHVWTHAIPARKSDTICGERVKRTRRLSLTFRKMRFS